MTIVFVGMDLAKNVLAVHGVNPAGKAERGTVAPSISTPDGEGKKHRSAD